MLFVVEGGSAARCGEEVRGIGCGETGVEVA